MLNDAIAALSGHGSRFAKPVGALACRAFYRLAHFADQLYRHADAQMRSPEWAMRMSVIEQKREQVRGNHAVHFICRPWRVKMKRSVYDELQQASLRASTLRSLCAEIGLHIESNLLHAAIILSPVFDVMRWRVCRRRR